MIRGIDRVADRSICATRMGGIVMKTKCALLGPIAFFVVCSAASGDYAFWDKGMWPGSWPKELEPLRKQARTYEGPIDTDRRYLISFTNRDEFESAWPHILKVKSQGAPIILMRGPKTDFFEVKPAGVLIKAPPTRGDKPANPETPLPGEMDARTKWRNTTYIELVVDGQIVDLNRIPLPPDTQIVDERFAARRAKGSG
jgi:hypothetical protein